MWLDKLPRSEVRAPPRGLALARLVSLFGSTDKHSGDYLRANFRPRSIAGGFLSTLYDLGLVGVGAVLGILSSGIFWWIQNHIFVPKITFSEELAEYYSETSKGTVRAKFENSGKRNIVDLSIEVRVAVLQIGMGSMWTTFSLEHNAEAVPSLSPGNNKLVNVFTPEFGVLPKTRLKREIQKKLHGVDDFRDLLQLGTKAHVRLYILGFDEFSGARKVFRSKRYYHTDIRKGKFKGLNVVERK